jgi:hypothetical protein
VTRPAPTALPGSTAGAAASADPLLGSTAGAAAPTHRAPEPTASGAASALARRPNCSTGRTVKAFFRLTTSAPRAATIDRDIKRLGYLETARQGEKDKAT